MRSGENKGKALLSHNIVTGMKKIGKWSGTPTAIPVSGFELADGEGCAVLAQDNRQGPSARHNARRRHPDSGQMGGQVGLAKLRHDVFGKQAH